MIAGIVRSLVALVPGAGTSSKLNDFDLCLPSATPHFFFLTSGVVNLCLPSQNMRQDGAADVGILAPLLADTHFIRRWWSPLTLLRLLLV